MNAEEVKSHTTLSAVIADSSRIVWDQKRSRGNRLWALCPFHNERTPSFQVNDDLGLYHCFGCGASGDVFTYVQHVYNLTFLQSLQWLADRTGVEHPPPKIVKRDIRRRDEITAKRHRAARTAVNAICGKCEMRPHPYLQNKGFPERPALVGQGKSGDDWIVVPVFADSTTIVSAQYISADGTKRFHPGGRIGGCYHSLRSSARPSEIWLCEGLATGLSIRDALTRRHLDRQSEVRVCFSAGNLAAVGRGITSRRVFAVADNDAAGIANANKIGCPVWYPPESGSDANDFANQVGVDALASLLRDFRLTSRRCSDNYPTHAPKT